MYFQFNISLIFLSLLFMLLAYQVGIKKQTWLLSGFNQARVRDKEKLAKIAGYYLLNSGFILLLNGLIHIPYQESFVPSTLIAYGICTILYVNKTMVE